MLDAGDAADVDGRVVLTGRLSLYVKTGPCRDLGVGCRTWGSEGPLAWPTAYLFEWNVRRAAHGTEGPVPH